jgi:outer membrane cobalamin receptor
VKKNYLRAFLTAGVTLCASHLAYADTSTDLNEVTVTARRLEETLPDSLAQYGTRLDVITRQEVVNGGYLDVAGSLRALTPGLYIQPKNGPFDYADISLLGSRTDDVLWLVDGVRINNRLYSTTPPLDTLPAAMIDKVQVLEGGQALFYGTSALAGAINIVTKPFSATPSGSLSLATDTFGGRHFDGNVADSIGINHFVLYGSSDKSDGYTAWPTDEIQPSASKWTRAYDVQMYGAKYGLDILPSLQLSATYQHTDADLDFTQPYRVDRDVNSRKEDFATAKLNYALNDNVGFFLKGYYHSWHTHYDTIYNDLQNPRQKIVLYDNAFWGYDDSGANFLSTFSFGPGLSYYLGYDLQSYGGRDEVLVIEQHKEITQAIFGQIRLDPDLLPRTHASLGVRYNHPNFGETATIWTLSGQYDISDSLFVRATMGTNFRLPSAEELFANDPLDERGNPNLRPEKSRSINLSIGGSIGPTERSMHWELIGYARDITDLIDFATYDEVTQQDVFGNVPGTVKQRGGEFSIDKAIVSDVTASASYTYNHSVTDAGEQLDRIPEDLAKASVDYHPSGMPFGVTATVNYVGDVGVTTGDERLTYGNYVIVNLSGRYFFDDARRNQLNVAIENLFDKQYGIPARGCLDRPTDGPYDCSAPYVYTNLGVPLTVRVSYTYTMK